MTLTVIPLNNMGVEVAGLDVAQPISDALKRDLIKLWDEHGVLLFRDQAIDPQTQIKFSHIFGDLAKAYDALDEASKVLLGKIEVTYTFSMQRRHMRFVDLEGYEPGAFSPIKPADMNFPNFPEVAYPAVVTHPVTGRKILEITEQMLERVVAPHKASWSNDEAVDLLQRLVEHIRKPEFHYFHQWREGDMILWDNWRAMHCATGTRPGIQRVIHRTTIAGDAVLGRVVEG